MICSQCGAAAPYVAKGSCLFCNGPLQLSACDVLGEGPKQIVTETRPQQVELAETIEKALLIDKPVIAEAGTGVGKSMALLIPAILQKKKTVVSTATLALQDQYFEKDLPFLAEELGNLGYPFRFALAKGKSNYVCRWKLSRLKKIKPSKAFIEWFTETNLGDKRELGNDVPSWWPKVSAEDCVGAKLCPNAIQCGYIRAKALLAQADVVVANHALYGFNILLGPGKILPAHDVYIIDEAHQAADYFRNALSSRINEVTIPNVISYMVESGAAAMIDADNFDRIERHNKMLFSKFPTRFDGSQERFDVAMLEDTVAVLEEELDILGGHCYGTFQYEEQRDSPDKNKLCILSMASKKIHRAQLTLSKLGSADPHEDVVFISYPRSKKGRRELVVAPIEIGSILQERLHSAVTTVAASATLAMGTDFSFRKKELGLDNSDPVEFITGSPFDFDHQSLLYCSTKVPLHPSRRRLRGAEYVTGLDEYFDGMAKEIGELLGYSKGGAFVLFTAYTEMQEVFKRTKKIVGALPMDIQKKNVPAASLGEWFKATPNAVLWGTRTWWQGADYPNMIRMVIITKTPFPIRGDLIYTAKKERLVHLHGGDSRRAFKELDVPIMIGDVRQGLGRLIRTMKDYGVAVILDRKITDQGNHPGTYANSLIQALPFTRITKSERNVIQFFRQRQGDCNALP